MFHSVWLQVKKMQVILSHIISFSWKCYTFSAVTSFYSDCSRSNSVPMEVKGNFATYFKGIWNQPLKTHSVKILKLVHCEECSPNAEKHIQWAMRSAYRQSWGARSRSGGIRAASAAAPTCRVGTELSQQDEKAGAPLGHILQVPTQNSVIQAQCRNFTLEHWAFPNHHRLQLRLLDIGDKASTGFRKA